MTAPTAALRLIVGLGNPGQQYARTRHNAGFWLVDALAEQQGGTFRWDSDVQGELCRILVAGQVIWLLKPMTFMNRSGASVATLARFHRIPLPQIFIVHDDLDLPVGTVRLKRSGGHGGHNGLRDLLTHVGGNDFTRARIGIGHPGDGRAVLDYVLRRAPADEQALLDQAIIATLGQLPTLVAGQWDQAMQALHSRKVASSALSDTAATPVAAKRDTP